MTVYVELLKDSQVLSSVNGCKSVVILACTGCANPCVAYKKNVPCEKIIIEEDKNKVLTNNRSPTQLKRFPVAILNEANRIMKLLRSSGIRAEAILWEWPCSTQNEDIAQLTNSKFSDKKLLELSSSSDCIITLSCAEGTLGVKRTLITKKVVPGMKKIGRAQFYLTLDESKKFTRIDKKRSKTIIPKNTVTKTLNE